MNFLNNTFVTLESPVSSSDRVIFVKKFIGNLSENFPLSAVLQESDSTGTIIKREIIRITGKNDTMLNVERAVEPCPQSDTAERPSQNPLNFSENAVIFHTLTAGDLGKILGKINDVQSGKTARMLNGHSRSYWVKFGTLKGEASRLNIKIMGGVGFNGNSHSQVGTNEIMLQIWNNDHERNCSGFYQSDFGSDLIEVVRVKKLSPYEWEIFAYVRSWTHKSIVEITYSGEFIEDFHQDISVDNASGNMIYDITKLISSISEQDKNSIIELTGTRISGRVMEEIPNIPTPVVYFNNEPVLYNKYWRLSGDKRTEYIIDLGEEMNTFKISIHNKQERSQTQIVWLDISNNNASWESVVQTGSVYMINKPTRYIRAKFSGWGYWDLRDIFIFMQRIVNLTGIYKTKKFNNFSRVDGFLQNKRVGENVIFTRNMWQPISANGADGEYGVNENGVFGLISYNDGKMHIGSIRNNIFYPVRNPRFISNAFVQNSLFYASEGLHTIPFQWGLHDNMNNNGFFNLNYSNTGTSQVFFPKNGIYTIGDQNGVAIFS